MGGRCVFPRFAFDPFPVFGDRFAQATLTFQIGPDNPTQQLAIVSGSGQTAPVGTSLPEPLVVQVTDQAGNPVGGVGVTWAMTGPDGQPAGSLSHVSTTTGTDGTTQVTATLGNQPGPYRITATCPSCTTGSPVVFEATAVGCAGLTVDVWPQEVYPAGTGGITTAAVTARVAEPAEGCRVEVQVEPRSSDGHDHGVHPQANAGTLLPMTCLIAPESSLCQVIYSAPQIAGEEQLTAILKQGTTEVERRSATMRIRVPGLEALTGSAIGSWQLTGQTGAHSSNHYGTPYANSRIRAMATEYFDFYGESIGINDMSLSGGGLFDHQGTWAPPHNSHRTGTSVDIDRCAQTLVRQRILNKIAEEDYSGDRTVERALKPPPCDGPVDTPRMHYEFR